MQLQHQAITEKDTWDIGFWVNCSCGKFTAWTENAENDAMELVSRHAEGR